MKFVLRDEKKEKEHVLEWFLTIESGEVRLKCSDGKDSWYVFKVTPDGVGHLADSIGSDSGLSLGEYGSIRLGNSF